MGFGDLRQTDWDHQFRSYNVPAGSFVDTPTVFAENLGHVWLDSLIVEDTLWVAGKVGYRLLLAGGIIVPANAAQFTYVGGFGGRQSFDVGIEVDTGVTVHGINFGQFPHFVFVTYKTTTIQNAIAAGLVTQAGQTIAPEPSPSTVATSAPVMQLAPLPSTTGGTVTSTLTSGTPTTAADVDVLALFNQVQALQSQVVNLQSEVANLLAAQQTGGGTIAPAPTPSLPGVPNTTPSAAGTPSTATVTPSGAPAQAPSGPQVTLPPAGGVVTLSDGQTQVNPYNPSGSLNITALGQIAADQGGTAVIVTPTGAQLPVTQGTLGGHPYTCIGTSC